jgi:anti-sigma regulatory factor (Ser/Thr protein kinase)
VKIIRTFSPKPTAPFEARQTLRTLDPVVPQGRLEELRLMVSELITNSVVHSGLEAEDSIVMMVNVLPERIRVEVVDHGRHPPIVSQSQRENHGRGLFIIDRLADRWGTERGSENKVWAELPLSA